MNNLKDVDIEVFTAIEEEKNRWKVLIIEMNQFDEHYDLVIMNGLSKYQLLNEKMIEYLFQYLLNHQYQYYKHQSVHLS